MSVNMSHLFKKFTLILTLVIITAGAEGAYAQANDVQVLQSQIKSLRQEIADLQRMVFKGEAPAKLPNTEAAPSLSSAPTSGQLGQVQGKVQLLEEQLRDLTGQYEVLDNRARRMDKRLDKLITDMDFRLNELERKLINNPSVAQNNSATTPPPISNTGSNVGNGAVASSPTTPTQPNSLGSLSGEQIKSFENGTLPGQVAGSQIGSGQTAPQLNTSTPSNVDSSNTSAASTPGSVATTENLPETAGSGLVQPTAVTQYASPKAEYKAAYGKLLKHDFDGAEQSMQSFIVGNEGHPLVGNAMYWLGETHYARKQYGDAASVFAETYQHDPKGRKAADSLLKLGMSLSQLGQTEDACVTYNVLLDNHKDANPVVLRNAAKKRIAQNCPAAE